MGSPDIAGHGGDAEVSQKIQKRIVETDYGPHTFCNRSQHIIHQNLFGRSPKVPKGFNKTLMKGFLPLAVGKGHIQHPAVGFYHGQGIPF